MAAPQAVQANPKSLIESVVRAFPPSSQDDARLLLNDVFLANLTALSPGGNLLQPGGAGQGAAAAPVGVTFTVAGSQGSFQVSIQDPAGARPGTVWHEVSYGPLASFTKDVQTVPATTATTLQIAEPGETYYFRMRVSFDRLTWSGYQLLGAAVASGLVSSTTTAPGATFNQTNYGVVASQADMVSMTATVTIGGTGGPLTPYVAQAGTAQAVRPSGTIVGVQPESQQFVGWDGSTFQLKPTLAAVMADNLEPVGAVSVVSVATPTLPTIVPVIVSGQIIAYNVTNGGAGASQPYTLTITDPGGGTGATAGPQTIVGGALLAVSPGNPGSHYSGATTVTASGGSGGGTTGGGTAAGGNGGRLTAV